MIRRMAPETTGRVVIPANHPLAKTLRPSQTVIDEITRQEHANALAWSRMRHMPVGASPAPEGIAQPHPLSEPKP